ncbi:hypothetical protein H6777_03390 [Candidatus Nomurabacteria bacterium]|nr:hypothetical protein [Candidatus Nomurabacteria bacterium]
MFSHKNVVIVVFLLTLFSIGIISDYSEKLASVGVILFITIWPAYILLWSHINKKKLLTHTDSNTAVTDPEDSKYLLNRTSTTKIDSEIINLTPKLEANQISLFRPSWVKYLAFFNLLLFVVGGKYILTLPLATFIGLAWGGRSVNLVLVMSIISSIGALCFVIFSTLSIILGFRKKYSNYFTKASKIIMFIPVISLIPTSVFILYLIFS